MNIFRIALPVIFFGFITAVHAEVIDSAAGGFSISNEVSVQSTPEAVYDAIIKDVGKWWDPAHTFFGKSENLTIEAKPGGCFCEIAGKKMVRHMTVVFLDPGVRVRLLGGLGPLQEAGVSGSLNFEISPIDTGSTVTLTYRVGGYVHSGLDKWASAVDGVLKGQLERLKNYAEKP